MKKIITIISVAVFTSCGPSAEQKALIGVNEVQPYYGVTVVKVDSCEYVCFRTGHGASITHKANCKNHH